MEAKSEVIVRDKAPKKGKPQKDDRRGVKPSDFNQNTHQPLINLSVVTIPDRYNEFYLDDSGFPDLATAVSRYVSDASDRYRSGVNLPNQIHDSILRICRAMFAKRLAYSPDEYTSTMYGRNLAVFKRMTMKCPVFLKTIVESYGFFKHNGASYRPLDLAFVAFNSFAHAVSVTGPQPTPGIPVDLDDGDYIVNVQYPDWRRALIRRGSTLFHTWAQRNGVVLTMPGGISFKASGFVSGFQQLIDMPANVWSVPPPPDIMMSLNVAAQVEALGAANPQQAWVQALRAFRIVLVDWDRELQSQLAGVFLRDHHAHIMGLMEHIFDVIDDKDLIFPDEGTPAQLVDVKRGGSVATYPFALGMKDIEMAIIMTNHTGYLIDPQQIESASAQSGNTARDLFVKSKLKGGVLI